MSFTVGQRWISNSESQLGLGLITEVSGRQVHIFFPAIDEDRIYAIDNAPLSRIIFKEEDLIVTNTEQHLTVVKVDDHSGIITYTCTDPQGSQVTINELALSCFIKLATPEQRLYSGLIDKLPAYKLRIETINHANRLQTSDVKGLLGSRTNHLPHQIYIANEVAQRYAPRVLLADEVGLGKTIEAGMILHYQLHTGRAQRVLIIVPDNLVHQWLVEMIRRFSLYFSIYDEDRFLPSDDESLDNELLDEPRDNHNLFENEQLIICSLDFLMSHDEARQQALAADWDLLVVDEAHHLFWSPDEPSAEYSFIEELSAKSKGLLLLTATPEQVGIESHFARLRLLDPSRFFDLEQFKQEEQGYQKINLLVQQLIEYQANKNTDTVDTEHKLLLKPYLGAECSDSINELIRQLLDRHGTGRVLFRNTRAAVKGFPSRHVSAYPLEKPAIYHDISTKSADSLLYPETTTAPMQWINQDPRVEWLSNKITELKPHKILIICAKASTALALEQHLKMNSGIRCSAFHEGLTIIERDRAAAYFAEEELGAQVLICSEIGSEGRNFQFAHHLVLFDLPLNPDLLEQRIGRLDRIGQRNDISLHVPFLLDTAQEIVFRWYHEGINLFEQSCSVGFSILEHFADRLIPLLSTEKNELALSQLIEDTRQHTQELNQILQQGRDRLLEMNSCNMPKALDLISHIESDENNLELESYMAKIYQEFGVDHEYHSSSTEILRPTEHMKTSHFPGLKEDGITVTYSRLKALIREDMEFLSWEHPIVDECMEMILDSELGNNTLTTISIKNIPPGTLFLETFYTVHCVAPKYLQLDRVLPLSPIRLLMNIDGKNLSKVLSYEQLNDLCEPVKKYIAYPIVKQIRSDIERCLQHSNRCADLQLIDLLSQAKLDLQTNLDQEISRLEALQKVNPAIRDEEIDHLKKLIVDSEYYIGSTNLKLQGLRVVINKG